MNDKFGHYKTTHPVTLMEQTVQFNTPEGEKKTLIKDVVTSICVILSFVISDLSDALHSFCASLPANKKSKPDLT